jgi:hypothetical protein
VAGVNPEHFKIIDDKLYLNWDTKGSEQFAAQAEKNIMQADDHWATLRAQQ